MLYHFGKSHLSKFTNAKNSLCLNSILGDSIQHANLAVNSFATKWENSIFDIFYSSEGQEGKNLLVFAGLNRSGQLGKPSSENYGVHVMQRDSSIKSFGVGRNFSYLLFSDAEENDSISVFGKAFNSTIPNLVEKDSYLVPGMDHLLCLNSLGLKCFGWNSDGQLGSSDESCFSNFIPDLNSKIVKKIDTFMDFSYVLLKNGSVYTFGNSEYGQCGTGGKFFKISTPEKVRLDHEIIDIACGSVFGAFLSKDNDLYVCGYGPFYPSGQESSIPVKIETGFKIKRLWAGDCHLILESFQNELFGLGMNDCGQLIPDQDSFVKIPRKIGLSSEKLQQIQCGFKHTLMSFK